MKIVHVSTNDISGGAARAAYRLHRGLLRLGHDSTMFVLRQRSHDPNIVKFQPSRELRHRLARRLRHELITRSFKRYKNSRPEGYERFSDDRSKYDADLVEQMPQADIINLHWVADFVDYQSFFGLVPQETPVVWTLHDMNPFTGGCHYDHNCGKFVEQCGACPQLGSKKEKDLSRSVWRRKQDALESVPLERFHVAANSVWMAQTSRSSSLLGRFPTRVVHLGLNTDVFAPRDRNCARSVLGVSDDSKVVLFAAQSLKNRRKGFSYLIHAVQDLESNSDIVLVSIGHRSPDIADNLSHVHLGHIDNDRLLSFIYSAADVFVIPSLQEAFGQTALEAMACGTPVVGFDVGGIPDMVRPGVTGQLAPVGDVDALREAIVEVLRDSAKRAEMSANCRRIAIDEYALEVQARRYVELYRSMLD